MTDSHDSPPDAPDAPGAAPGWREIHHGGSPEAEEAHFRDLADVVVGVQRTNKRKSGSQVSRRTFHAKIVVGVDNAELAFRADLPADLGAGDFTAGARLPAIVRLSNASGTVRPDGSPDLRGAALKITLPGGGEHDLLMTSYPVSHARDATQFVEIARIGAGPKPLVLPRMLARLGPSETARVLGNLRRANRPSPGLALESYWSRGAVLWGDTGPVRFRLSPHSPLSPLDGPAPASAPPPDPADSLQTDFAARLSGSPVRFALHIQKYVSERLTPIEDGAIEWKESDSPWLDVATLTIPAQNILDPKGRATCDHVDTLAFNPWHAPAEFRPLGNLNRARRTVYAASAREWHAR
ncbi:catalase [Streptomyces sp. Ag109_O5-1]|uniref:catalase n=1 Tax=Streptomyces sp. Ag109_O5-1 TaxID=1938851 RepID=UPI000F4F7D53|nr:catalase [Streptomyces sp. Ag109_O5-1]RPE43108.1 catalase [Streptomyces sp. Ag109_O5-1]